MRHKTALKNYEKISQAIKDFKRDEGPTNFPDFLKFLNISYSDYILALRSAIKPGQKKSVS